MAIMTIMQFLTLLDLDSLKYKKCVITLSHLSEPIKLRKVEFSPNPMSSLVNNK